MKSKRCFLILALSAGSLLLSGGAQADYPPRPDYYDDDRHYHYPPPPPDYNRRPDPGYCDYYARERADRYARSDQGALGGVVKGGAGGAIFGAIVGGKKGARRGALAGAGLGVVANGMRNQRERDYAYTRAYEDCMSGFRR